MVACFSFQVLRVVPHRLLGRPPRRDVGCRGERLRRRRSRLWDLLRGRGGQEPPRDVPHLAALVKGGRRRGVPLRRDGGCVAGGDGSTASPITEND